jgi:hypothetical protein
MTILVDNANWVCLLRGVNGVALPERTLQAKTGWDTFDYWAKKPFTQPLNSRSL